MRTAFVALLVSGVLATWAVSGEIVVTSEPLGPSLEGYSAYMISIELDAGETFRGVDGRFDGPMHQEVFGGPLRQPNFVQDLDTYFNFFSPQVLTSGVGETESSLFGAISGLSDLPAMPFAQVVTNQPWNVEYDLAIDLGGVDPVVFRGTLVPEPSTLSVAPLMAVFFVATRRGDQAAIGETSKVS